MYQSEKTQLMIIMKNMSGTITNSCLSLTHQRTIQPGSDAEPSFSRSSAEYVSVKLVGDGDKPLSLIVNLLAIDLALWGLSKLLQHSLGYEGSWRFLETSLQREMESLYRWWKRIWDPYIHGIGPILKEASMGGGKLLPLHGNPEPNVPTQFRDQFRSWLESIFCHLSFKNTLY